MSYIAPDGTRWPSRYRFETRNYTSLHVYDCLTCGEPLDVPFVSYRRSDAEYCSDAHRAKAWRAARKGDR